MDALKEDAQSATLIQEIGDSSIRSTLNPECSGYRGSSKRMQKGALMHLLQDGQSYHRNML
jgi:hypothetical protein